MANSNNNNLQASILVKNQKTKSSFGSNFKSIAFSKSAYFADSFDHQKICIHKFGGSSLASRNRLLNVVNIIEEKIDKEDFIVVSANNKITDWLIDFINGNENSLNIIKEFYDSLLVETLNSPGKLLLRINSDIEKLRLRQLTRAEILAFGEVWSATVLVAILNEKGLPSLFVDARDLLKCNSIHNHSEFEIEYFFKGVEKNIYGNFGKRLVITGYIASDLNSNTITLGRNGSDYTASLLANLSEAQSATLWTDVTGIFSADPSLIKQAQPISYLSYNEAKALASSGTNVLHHKSINSLVEQKIPLYIRSSLSPEVLGTCVSEVSFSRPAVNSCQVKSIALKQKLYKFVIHFEVQSNLACLTEKLLNNNVSIIETEKSQIKNQITLLIDDNKIEQTKTILSKLNLIYVIETEPRSLISLIGNKIAEQLELSLLLKEKLSHLFQFRVLESGLDDSVLLLSKDKQVVELLESIYELFINNHDDIININDESKGSLLVSNSKRNTDFNNVTNLTLKKVF